MLILNKTVPPALILPEEIRDMRAHLTATGAHWFHMHPGDLELSTEDAAEDPPSIQALHSCTTDQRALPVASNRNNTVYTSDPTPGGLAFQEDIYCGFHVPDLDMDAQNWSLALRFLAPHNAAKTLFTLKPEKVENYMFVQQAAGQILFKDQQTTQELAQAISPLPSAPHLLIVGMSEGRLWMRVNTDATARTPDPAPIDLSGPKTLFIGCRTHKTRLQKTLGHFVLRDLVLWPRQNILEAQYEETCDALDNPTLWEPYH